MASFVRVSGSRFRFARFFAGAVLCGGLAHSWGAAFSRADLDFFEKRIRPVLVERCHECHGARSTELKAGLYLDSRKGVLSGGETLRPAVIAGEPERSLLIDAVRYQNPDLQMPPKGRLPDDQIDDLAAWVRMGVPWPEGDSLAPATGPTGFDLDARRASHWAWQRGVPQSPPRVRPVDWPRTPVDRFILEKLQEHGFSPAPDADRRSLIRRVYFDLIGLPPSPEEVETFVRDRSPGAYGSVVDRLLSRPQFGERWARHWMDLVRYAETLGHEFDYSVPNAWRYRDYLIRAFNADVPYDQFAREHIAGDLLPNPRRHPREGFNESIIGTGFYWLGQQTHSPVDVRQNQADVIENQIDVLTKTFLGLTVACARCHDHKFDAISTRDYYSLYGIIESSRYAQRSVEPEGETKEAVAQLRDLKSGLREWIAAEWKNQLPEVNKYLLAAGRVLRGRSNVSGVSDEADPGLAPDGALDGGRLHRWVESLKIVSASDGTHPMAPWVKFASGSDFNSQETFEWRWESYVASAARFEKRDSAGANDSMVPFADFRYEGYEKWFVEGELLGGAPSRAGELIVSGAERASTSALRVPSAHSGTLSAKLQGTLRSRTFTITNRFLHMLVSGRSSRINVFVDNFALIQSPIYGELRQVLNDDQWKWLRIDLEMWKGHKAYIEFSDMPTPDLAGGGSRQGYASDGYFGVSRIVFSDRPGAPEDEAVFPLSLLLGRNETIRSLEQLALGYEDAIADAVDAWGKDALDTGVKGAAQVSLVNWLLEAQLLERGEVDDAPARNGGELSRLINQYREIEDSLPSPIRVPAMSDGNGLDERVFIRGNPELLGETVSRRFLEAIDGTEPFGFDLGSGRIDLAERITNPSNPLFARVRVNRIWHHLFGRGLVATPDDFGVLGQRPSHPELLDWLAACFRDQARWSTKKLVRLLVMSRTYRMSSKPLDFEVEEKDPDNVWLHRMRVRRLEGETIRDAILSASGRLDPSLFGPSVPVHLTEFMDGRGRPGTSGPIDGAGRRSLYLEVRRNFPSPMMRTFDSPVPFTTVGRRTVSNVPAQSLILMNDPFVVEQARIWAERLAGQQSGSPRQKVQALYMQAFARLPSAREVDEALAFLDRQSQASGGRTMECWADLCHVLFNVKEFIFIN